MGIWKNIIKATRIQAATNRVQEAALYEVVANELEQGVGDKGIWAKSLAECDGNEARAKARYLKLRVQALQDQVEILGHAKSEAVASKRINDEAERQRYERLLRLSENTKGYGRLY